MQKLQGHCGEGREVARGPSANRVRHGPATPHHDQRPVCITSAASTDFWSMWRSSELHLDDEDVSDAEVPIGSAAVSRVQASM